MRSNFSNVIRENGFNYWVMVKILSGLNTDPNIIYINRLAAIYLRVELDNLELLRGYNNIELRRKRIGPSPTPQYRDKYGKRR